jgi:hypothetical protein
MRGFGLDGQGPISTPVLQNATNRISSLLASLPIDPASDASSPSQPRAAPSNDERQPIGAALRNAVGVLVSAAERSSQVGAPPIVISSDALNISVQKLPADSLCASSDQSTSVAAPIQTSIATGPRTVHVELPSGLLSDLTNSTEPIAVRMWSSNRDVHGTGSSSNQTITGQVVSVSLSQAGAPLNVNGTSRSILITMPIYEASMHQLNNASGAARPCVGQPTAKSLFERAQGGDHPCESVVQCRFWDESLSAWSTEGCESVTLVDGGLGCSCTHLTDFIAVQVPSTFQGEIEFAQLNVDLNSTLQCKCNYGISGQLRKTISGPEPRSMSVDMIDSHDLSWRLLEVIYHGNTTVDWLQLVAPNGTRRNPVRLNMFPQGLAERGGEQMYRATVDIEVINVSFAARVVNIPVEVGIAADVVANTSSWGTIPAETSCSEGEPLTPLRVQRGEQRDIDFTACDFDSLPVAHSLPNLLDRRVFSAVAVRVDSTSTAAARLYSDILTTTSPMPVRALGGSRYRISFLVNHAIGLHLLTVHLAGEQLPVSMPILVTCPSPMVSYENISCGCSPGSEANHELQTCSPCRKATFQSRTSRFPCQPCAHNC